MKQSAKDLEILQDRIEARNKIKGPRVGDYLKLPYGLHTRFTHLWDESIQTGGGSSSFYLGSGGYCSYSGGLDSGVKLTDIQETTETMQGLIWFFSNDYHVAHNGVNFEIPCKVFELKEGADLSGLPQIKAHEKKVFIDSLPKIERYNGNGQLYSLPLPEIVINAKGNLERFIESLFKQTGLKFKIGAWGQLTAQPTQTDQYLKLLVDTNFKTKYYNNSSYSNTLVLEFNRD